MKGLHFCSFLWKLFEWMFIFFMPWSWLIVVGFPDSEMIPVEFQNSTCLSQDIAGKYAWWSSAFFFSSFFPCCNCSILWQECYFIVSLIQVVKSITGNSNKIKRCQVLNEGSNLNRLIPHGNIHVIEGILYLWILQWINILFRSKHSRKLYATFLEG